MAITYDDYVKSLRQAAEQTQDFIRKNKKAEEEMLRKNKAAAVAAEAENEAAAKGSFESSAREAYINKKTAERELPQRLAAMGLSGGLSESSGLKIESDYGNSLNQSRSDYEAAKRQIENNKSQINQKYDELINKSNISYDQKLQESVNSLNEMLAKAIKEERARRLAAATAATAKASSAKAENATAKSTQSAKSESYNNMAVQNAYRLAKGRLENDTELKLLSPEERSNTIKDSLLRLVQRGRLTNNDYREVINRLAI